MTACAGKTQSSDDESGVTVHRENAKIFGFQQICVFLGLCGKNVGRVDGQWDRNRAGY